MAGAQLQVTVVTGDHKVGTWQVCRHKSGNLSKTHPTWLGAEESVAEVMRVYVYRTASCILALSGDEWRALENDGHLPGLYEALLNRHSTLYNAWDNMMARCHNPNDIAYHYYGARGITVCEQWRLSAAIFLVWALTHGYAPGLWLDRRDNDGSYSPDNCRWVTPSQNGRNTRQNRLLTVQGETKSIVEWAEDARCMVSATVLRSRVQRNRDWDDEAAVLTPPVSREERHRQGYVAKRRKTE